MNDTFYTHIYRFGKMICHRGYENGERVQYKVEYKPKLYLNSKKKTKYQTIHGQYLQEFSPGNINDSKEFLETYKGAANVEIYGNTDWIIQYISDLYPSGEFVEYDKKLLRILNIDIETECENGFSSSDDADERINVVTISSGGKKWVYALNNFELPENPNLTQKIFLDETHLLAELIDTINAIDPDVISGWNVRFFDIPYLVNRIKKVLDTENSIYSTRISPWNSLKEEEVNFRGKICNCYKIAGISILDYYELYRKYTYTQQENYKLDTIAKIELGKSKISYSEYDSIKDFYTKNFQKFVEYNVVDVEIVDDLDKKLNLIDLHISMAYFAKINYEDAFGQVKTWDSMVYNYLKPKNIIIPPKIIKDKDHQYEGAYVKDPLVGSHDWVVSFDLASLYPHLIMQYNIGPDTLSDKSINIKLQDLLSKSVDLSNFKDLSVAANGTTYIKTKQSFFSELMQFFYDKRKSTKKLAISLKKNLEEETDQSKIQSIKNEISILDTKQMSYKIFLNSAYGAIGNPAFRYYDMKQAEAITLSGQLSIKWIENKINCYLNKLLKSNKDYIIAVDTDSVYINLSDLVQSLFKTETDKTKIINGLDKFCSSVLTPYINKSFEELSLYMNAYAQKMEMKREVIADRGIWTAKKRYCLNVYDSEGVRYHEPKLKIMGIEVQRSSTPKICRDALKKCIKICLSGNEESLQEYIEEFKDKFYNADPSDIAFPRGVNGINTYKDELVLFKKGTPIHVKGAILYNNALNKFNISKKYEKIIDGDKIKYLYLKQPNTLGDKVISFIKDIPKEFKIESYVDRDLQFEKAFLDPLENILLSVKWNWKKQVSLDSFFE